jgi:hypothetical protein
VNDYYHCIGFCPYICVDPKSVGVISDRTENLGTAETGNNRCLGSNPPRIYAETLTTFQRTRITRTEYCDGTYRDDPEYFIWYRICWAATPWPCLGTEGGVPPCETVY